MLCAILPLIYHADAATARHAFTPPRHTPFSHITFTLEPRHYASPLPPFFTTDYAAAAADATYELRDVATTVIIRHLPSLPRRLVLAFI